MNYQSSKYTYDGKEMPDGDWYWKLYFDGEPINGGIAHSELHCRDLARAYMAQHQKSEFNLQYVWDVESHQWISRSDIEVLRDL